MQQALKLNPTGAGYEGELGTLETFVNHFDVAEQAFARALQANPADYVALTGMGLLRSPRAVRATRRWSSSASTSRRSMSWAFNGRFHGAPTPT